MAKISANGCHELYRWTYVFQYEEGMTEGAIVLRSDGKVLERATRMDGARVKDTYRVLINLSKLPSSEWRAMAEARLRKRGYALST